MDQINKDIRTIRERLDHYILYGTCIKNPVDDDCAPDTSDNSYDAPHNRHLIAALIYGSCVSLFIVYVTIVLTLLI